MPSRELSSGATWLPAWLRTAMKNPRAAGIFMIVDDYRSSKIRMISGIGIPSSQRRMGMSFPFLVEISSDLAAPRAVAKAAAFGGGEAGAEGAEQQRGRQPERELHGGLAGGVDIGLAWVTTSSRGRLARRVLRGPIRSVMIVVRY